MYEDAGATGTFLLDYILTPEGELEDLGSLVEFHYNLKDHLGNTRVDFDKNGINQQIDYYPFGMAFNSSLGGNNKYLYNGKEIQDEELGGVNLDWYDYGARFYDPMIGRWNSPDPLAEYYFNMTPYHYVFNNPIRFIDLFGLDGDEPPVNQENPIELPGVDVYPTPSNNDSWFNNTFIPFMWQIENGMYGNQDYQRNRDATRGEEWIIRSVDQNEVNNIGGAVGDGRGEATNRNTVNTDASYKGTSDKEIMNKTTENSPQARPEESTIVKTYTGKGKYKNWKREELALGGVLYTAPTKDSTLLVDAKGDSTLFVPWSGGGKTIISLKDKK